MFAQIVALRVCQPAVEEVQAEYWVGVLHYRLWSVSPI